MQIPFFSKHIHSKKEYYLGLFLQEDKATGYIYELNGTDISIISDHSQPYSNGLENIVEDIDDILFRLETDTNKKLKKTIFFVTSQFVDETTKEITRESKLLIKSLVKELDLEAMGFIECYEAVAALLSRKDGVQLNAVLVELQKDKGSVYIYKNGKKMFDAAFDRTESLLHDLVNLFSNLKGEFLLPSRLVLYPFKESHKELVHLINHHWREDTFVQLPRVQALTEEELNIGLSQTFALQMNDDAATEERTSAAFEPSAKPQTPQSSPLQPSQREVMGFVIGSDTMKTEREASSDVSSQNLSESPENEMGIYPDEEAVVPPKKKFALPSIKLPFTISALSSLRFKAPWIIPVVIAVLLLALFGIEVLSYKVTVQVSFPSKTIQKEVALSSTDVSIKAGSVSAQISDQIATTGKRDIGEKAKGEVTVDNFDDKDKVIAKGTEITADGKSFSLDQDIKVASASFNSDSSAKLPGKVKATVTADAIGPDSNLDKGKKFTIADLSPSLYFAINETSFSGGTKRQARTVAQKDIDDLKTKVMAAGKQQGLDEIRKQVSADQQIIDPLTTQKLDSPTFSKEVGDEADSVNIQANVETIYYAYADSDMKKFLQSSLQSEVPAGYSLPSDKITATIKDATQKNGDISVTVAANGTALKEVPKDKVAAMIAGKGKDEVDRILRSQLDAVDYKVKSSGLVFFPLSNMMPFSQKNITVEVTSQ